MRWLTAIALTVFCTILILFRSELLAILLSKINLQKLPSINASTINMPNLLPVNHAIAAKTIPASEASRHIGERMTVCGRIASERIATGSRGTPTLINLDKPYAVGVFTVGVWGSDRASVGAIPSSGMLCATGVISSYRGSPEIAVKDAKSWYVPK